MIKYGNKWLGLFQIVSLLLALSLSVPALIEWRVWNGMDLLAVICWAAFIWSGAVAPEPPE